MRGLYEGARTIKPGEKWLRELFKGAVFSRARSDQGNTVATTMSNENYLQCIIMVCCIHEPHDCVRAAFRRGGLLGGGGLGAPQMALGPLKSSQFTVTRIIIDKTVCLCLPGPQFCLTVAPPFN